MRKLLVALLALTMLDLAGCSGGDVNRAVIDLGKSSRFTSTDLHGAADAVLAEFRGLSGDTLQRLTYDEESSDRQKSLSDPPPAAGEDVIIFTSVFTVDGTRGDGTLEPGSTQHWTWEVRRSGAHAQWKVANRGAG